MGSDSCAQSKRCTSGKKWIKFENTPEMFETIFHVPVFNSEIADH